MHDGVAETLTTPVPPPGRILSCQSVVRNFEKAWPTPELRFGPFFFARGKNCDLRLLDFETWDFGRRRIS